jgi:dephospho-CoA kinase
MLITALTGGIGSGKSTAGELFSQLGARVIDSDKLARDVLVPGTEGFNQVVQSFGEEIIKDGAINRAVLGAKVFSDPAARIKLEAITHPLIRQAFANFVANSPSDSIIINQIPLLVESKHDYKFDAVINISSNIANRTARLLARGLTQSEIDQRLKAQATDSQREEISDFIIQNDTDLPALKLEVERVYRALQLLNQGKQ